MIFGIGCDIVNTVRLPQDEERLQHFIRKCFSEREQEAYRQRTFKNLEQKILYVAKRFAAKEAVSKALGTGFRDGLHLSDIEIFNDSKGCPFVCLTPDFAPTKSYTIYLSLSDDTPFAQAFALITTP